jgi:hypothetical protein
MRYITSKRQYSSTWVYKKAIAYADIRGGGRQAVRVCRSPPDKHGVAARPSLAVTLVSCLTQSNLKMEAICTYETSADSLAGPAHTSALRKLRCENLQFYTEPSPAPASSIRPRATGVLRTDAPAWETDVDACFRQLEHSLLAKLTCGQLVHRRDNNSHPLERVLKELAQFLVFYRPNFYGEWI